MAAVCVALTSFCCSQAAKAVSIAPPVQVGTFTSNSLREVSGIVGGSTPGTVWAHNDSGDSARFFAVGTDGTLLGQYSLSGASNVDWEDMARGPKAGGGNYLYFGDMGDNDFVRSEIAVYRVTEPTSTAGGSVSAADYTKARLQYPAAARNAESLMVDPLSGDLFIVTKNPGGQVYRAGANVFDTPAQVHPLSFLGNVNAPLVQPSAADISPDGLHILVRDRSTTAYLFERSASESVWDALQRPGLPVTLAAEVQGEAIGWAASGLGFYTVSEQDGQGPRPLYYYAFSVPEPSTYVLMVCGLTAMAASGIRRIRRGRVLD